MNCKNCGEKYEEGAKFCEKCGCSLEEKEPKKKKKKEKVKTGKGKKITIIILLVVLLATSITELVLLIVKSNQYKDLKKDYDHSVLLNTANYNKYDACETEKKELQGKYDEIANEDTRAKIQEEIKGLEDKKTSLQTELDGLNKEVIRVKGEGKTYPAGYLTVGDDIPPGRYKISGGSSNFFVHSSSGALQVNIILGGRYGVEEYLYTFKNGDKVQAESSFKLTPIE